MEVRSRLERVVAGLFMGLLVCCIVFMFIVRAAYLLITEKY
jgi:hypothetical protein